MKAAKITALLATAFLCVCTGLAVLDVSRTVTMLPSVIHREADLTRDRLETVVATAQDGVSRALQAQGDAARRMVASEVRRTRAEALGGWFAHLSALEGNLDRRAGEALVMADRQLTETNRTLARETAALNGSVAQVAMIAPPLTATLNRVQEVVEIGTDCEASPRCWQNTLYDMNAASQKSAAAFADLTIQVDGIATDLHRWTTAATAPVAWWRKLLWTGGELTARGLTR